MSHIVSADGTTIAFSQVGQGPALILVDGALSYRGFGPSEPLAASLAPDFTVYTYDRRGRGASADTQPYAVQREIEDLDALIREAGGSAYLYGVSAGAVLALRAASSLGSAKVPKLALYEAPFSVGDEEKEEFATYAAQVDALLAANQRGEALAFFFADMVPPDMLDEMKQSPDWPLMEALAHTLAYDNAVMGDSLVPVAVASAVTVPTLVLVGADSPDFKHRAADDLATRLPDAQRHTLPNQAHSPAPDTLGPLLTRFFNPDSIT